MKKFFLSLMIAGLSFLGFSNAESVTFQGASSSYTPNSLTISSSYTMTSSSITYNHSYDDEEQVNIVIGTPYTNVANSCCEFMDDLDSGSQYFFDCSSENSGERDSCTLNAGTYNVGHEQYNTNLFSDITFSGLPSAGGSSSTGSSSVILPGGYSSLTPAIDGLKGTVSQLIPFVVYIGIGVLVAVLGFYAIRWLVNWMGKKVNSVFISKRK